MGSPLPPTLKRRGSKKTLLARLTFPGESALRTLAAPRLTRLGEFCLPSVVLRAVGGASVSAPPSSNAFTCLCAFGFEFVDDGFIHWGQVDDSMR